MNYQDKLHRANSRKKDIKKLLNGLEKNAPKHLDEQFEEFHEVVFSEIDCLQCANCCKTTSPIFLMSDVKRLAKALNMTVKDFMIEYLTMDEDEDFVLTQTPCPFLASDNKCSVYDDRPKACREYPHTNRKRMHQIMDLTYENAMICPAVSDIVDLLQKSTK